MIEWVTMFSFQRYHFHFGVLTEKENVIIFVDRTRLLFLSIYTGTAFLFSQVQFRKLSLICSGMENSSSTETEFILFATEWI